MCRLIERHYVLTDEIAPVGKEALQNSGTVAASLFFRAVFGESNSVRGFNILVALSAFGNLIAVMLGAARMLRESGRYEACPVIFPALFGLQN